MQMVEPQTMMAMFFGMMMLFALGVPTLYFVSNWQEIKITRKANCLIWRHPDNTPDSLAILELVEMEKAPGGFWPYKSFFFLPEKQIKWCYEVKEIAKGTGEATYKIEPYIPDDHIDYNGVTAGELADALDWRPAKRLLEQKAPLMQKIAQGGVLIMGLASLFGIMALLDMLGKGG